MNWSTQDTEVLIHYVRKNNGIWQKGALNYRRLLYRENVFQEIQRNLKDYHSIDEIKRRFKSLKEIYNRYRKTGNGETPRWAYYEEMTFLDEDGSLPSTSYSGRGYSQYGQSQPGANAVLTVQPQVAYEVVTEDTTYGTMDAEMVSGGNTLQTSDGGTAETDVSSHLGPSLDTEASQPVSGSNGAAPFPSYQSPSFSGCGRHFLKARRRAAVTNELPYPDDAGRVRVLPAVTEGYGSMTGTSSDAHEPSLFPSASSFDGESSDRSPLTMSGYGQRAPLSSPAISGSSDNGHFAHSMPTSGHNSPAVHAASTSTPWSYADFSVPIGTSNMSDGTMHAPYPQGYPAPDWYGTGQPHMMPMQHALTAPSGFVQAQPVECFRDRDQSTSPDSGVTSSGGPSCSEGPEGAPAGTSSGTTLPQVPGAIPQTRAAHMESGAMRSQHQSRKRKACANRNCPYNIHRHSNDFNYCLNLADLMEECPSLTKKRLKATINEAMLQAKADIQSHICVIDLGSMAL